MRKRNEAEEELRTYVYMLLEHDCAARRGEMISLNLCADCVTLDAILALLNRRLFSADTPQICATAK